jgi:hypothetical protein
MIVHALTYRCPHCGTTVEVLPQSAGEVVLCPHPGCGKPFRAEVPGSCPEPARDLVVPGGKPARHGDASGEAVVAAAPPAPAVAPPPPAPAAAPAVVPAPTVPDDQPLEVIRVSMGRRYPLRCLIYLVLVAGSSVGIILFLSQGLNVLAGISAAVLLVVLLRFVPWWLRMRNTLLMITNRRVMLETGVLHHEATEFERGELIDVRVLQHGLMRLFDVGDLVITSGSAAKKEVVLMAVPHPEEVAEHLRELRLPEAPKPAAG